MQPRTTDRAGFTRVGWTLFRITLLLCAVQILTPLLKGKDSGDDIVALDIPIQTGATALPLLRIGSPRRLLATNAGERIQFRVYLTRPIELPVHLDYHTTNRTAIAGRDYIATSGRITLQPGSVESMVEVELLASEDSGQDLWFQLVGSTPRTSPPPVIQPAVAGVGTLRTHLVTGGIAGFSWSPLPAAVEPGASIVLGLQALDPKLMPASEVGSKVRILAYPGSGRPNPVVLFGFDITGSGVHIHSTVDREVSLEGWRLHLYDEQSWPHPGVTWIGGPTNVLQPLGLMKIEAATAGSVLTSLRWAPGDSGLGLNRPMAALLQDPSGNAVDFFSIGGARSIDMEYPIRLIPGEWPGFETGNRPQPWIGGSISGSGLNSLNFDVFIREGSMTRGAADEWSLRPWATNPGDSISHRLLLPWRQSSVEPLLLGEVQLNSEGAWQGTLTLPTAVGPWRLVAEAENGRRTFSPMLRVGSGGDLGIVRFDVVPVLERRSTYPVGWGMTVSNGSAIRATNVVARVRHGRVPPWTGSHSWVSKADAVVRQVDADPLHGPHIEARLGDLAPGEFVELGGNLIWYNSAIAPTFLAGTVMGESGDSDEADNFVSRWTTIPRLVVPASPTEIVWSGEDGTNSLDGAHSLRFVGDISLFSNLGRPAFRVGSANSWIEIPGELGSHWGSPTNGSLEFQFRLPLGDRRAQTMTLISFEDPSRPGYGYRLDIEAGTLLAYLGDTRQGGRIQDPVRTWDSPVDFRDGQWHSVVLSRSPNTASGGSSIRVSINGLLFWTLTIPSDFPLAGTGIPVRIGGAPGRNSLLCDIDDIAMGRRNEAMGRARLFKKARVEMTSELSRPFAGLDSATAQRPFTLRFRFTNRGPFASETVYAMASHPANWTLLSATYAGGGRMFETWAGFHFELGALAPDQERRLALTYVGPAGSNSLFVQTTLPAFDSVSAGITIPVVIDSDADGDGLPDGWEAEVGLSSEDPADARLDVDGDGIDALGEFEAGTDPEDSDSVLAIQWTEESTGRWILRIRSQAGRVYHLERSAESGLGMAWEIVDELVGTGDTLELGELEPAGELSRLYRVRVRRDR